MFGKLEVKKMEKLLSVFLFVNTLNVILCQDIPPELLETTTIPTSTTTTDATSELPSISTSTEYTSTEYISSTQDSGSVITEDPFLELSTTANPTEDTEIHSTNPTYPIYPTTSTAGTIIVTTESSESVIPSTTTPFPSLISTTLRPNGNFCYLKFPRFAFNFPRCCFLCCGTRMMSRCRPVESYHCYIRYYNR